MVVVVILAALFVIPYFTQSPIVGTWHLTKENTYASNGTLVENSSIDEYMVFNASGTGYDYIADNYGGQPFNSNYTWKDLGNNKIELNPENSSYIIKMGYQIYGNSITLITYFHGNRIEASGERVNGIPTNATRRIGDWKVYIDGKYTNEIVATTQPDGTATWIGNIMIIVDDQYGKPLPTAQVELNGAGIYQSGETDSNGVVHFYGVNITLPSGVNIDSITVTISYHGQITTSISVMRG